MKSEITQKLSISNSKDIKINPPFLLKSTKLMQDPEKDINLSFDTSLIKCFCKDSSKYETKTMKVNLLLLFNHKFI